MQSNIDTRDHKLQSYYKLHARIYDLTRWSFLFGRKAIISRIAALFTPRQVLEVGCGTGRNLHYLAMKFPQAELSGIDMSGDMLRIAKNKLAGCQAKVNLQQKSYPTENPVKDNYDLILFSYSLSMFNPGWEEAIAATAEELSENGLIAVVDFHNSPFSGFKKWMGINHVKMEGHLLPVLEQHFQAAQLEIRPAYLGLWSYLLFIGTRKTIL